MVKLKGAKVSRTKGVAIVAAVALGLAVALQGCASAGAKAVVESEAAPSVGPFSKGTVRGVAENEAGDGVSTGTAATIAKYVSDNATDTDNLGKLYKALPLGKTASVTGASADGTVEVSYKNVDHLLQWNSLWTALSYNAMATFVAVNGTQTVKFSVINDNEPDTAVNSVDVFIFNRADMEAAAGEPLTKALLDDSTWDQLKASTVSTGNWVNGVAGAARKAGYAEENAAAKK